MTHIAQMNEAARVQIHQLLEKVKGRKVGRPLLLVNERLAKKHSEYGIAVERLIRQRDYLFEGLEKLLEATTPEQVVLRVGGLLRDGASHPAQDEPRFEKSTPEAFQKAWDSGKRGHKEEVRFVTTEPGAESLHPNMGHTAIVQQEDEEAEKRDNPPDVLEIDNREVTLPEPGQTVFMVPETEEPLNRVHVGPMPEIKVQPSKRKGKHKRLLNPKMNEVPYPPDYKVNFEGEPILKPPTGRTIVWSKCATVAVAGQPPYCTRIQPMPLPDSTRREENDSRPMTHDVQVEVECCGETTTHTVKATPAMFQPKGSAEGVIREALCKLAKHKFCGE